MEWLPSLLAANQARLSDAVKCVETCGLSTLHVDVMDGHFVPNISMGPQVVKDLSGVSNLFLDVHLMLTHPQKFVSAFAHAGARRITVHVEIGDKNLRESLETIRCHGVEVGLAINPETPIEMLYPHLGEVNRVVVMSVHPGFSGQVFLPEVLEKTKKLAKRKLNFTIAMDGGVNESNVIACVKAGATSLVLGATFFASSDPCRLVKHLNQLFVHG